MYSDGINSLNQSLGQEEEIDPKDELRMYGGTASLLIRSLWNR